MSFRKLAYLGLSALLLFMGCGLKEGVIQKEQKSYLWFTGNTDNAIVYIDELEPITLNKTYISKGENGVKKKEISEKIHYEISPGKHRIVIKTSGEVVVNRIVLLGNGTIKEIQVP